MIGKIKELLFLLYVNILKWKGKKIIHVFHIRKNAGSALNASFQSLSNGLFSNVVVLKRHVFITHNHNFTICDVKKDEGFFVVLRDPVSRFVSGFNSRLRKGQPKNYNEWSFQERQSFQEFTNPNELAEALTSSDIDKKRRAKQAMESINHVKTYQKDWVSDILEIKKYDKKMVFLLRQENLSYSVKELLSTLDIKFEMIDKADIKAHVAKEGVSPLTQLAKTNIIKWYSKDFELIENLENSGYLKKL